MKTLRVGCIGAMVFMIAGSAFAHHSAAMFDRDKTVELVGTIVTFSWTNPHSWIEIDVPNSAGGTDRWGVECNSPNNMARTGWRASTLKTGDQVTIVIHPLRSGEKGGRFVSVKLADGQVLTDTAGYPSPKP
ncbi:MAG TPA: DUF6152 family protein [Candidatus Acidoferrales bacterium]|nr:DUF6152 family protein [Candidatus Acidoferrales bacterium]